MRLLVDRFVSDSDATVSRISLDGEFVCFGLEDEFREDKTPGETRIGAGSYAVRLRAEGGFHERYAVRFADIHEGMLHIQDVPEFEHILVHCGNTDEDTAGCLLVGSQAQTDPGDMRVTQSVAAYRRLYRRVVDAAAADDLRITFVDNDGAAPRARPAASAPERAEEEGAETVTVRTSDDWDMTNLAHRFTMSFFKSQYGDDPDAIAGSADFRNRRLAYLNEADSDHGTAATICAALLVTHMESQGIPYHPDKTRKQCFEMLSPHLADADGRVLHTADIVDRHFRFINEATLDG